MENQSFKDLNIWITGASRGIGAAITRKLYEKGSTLVLSAREFKSFESAKKELSAVPNIFFFPFDIASETAINKVFDKISSTIGNINVLINNAGAARFATFQELSLDDFDNMNNINYRGIFLCTKAVLPAMIENNFGIIININSVAATTIFKNSSIYSASKAAALAMSRTLREEVRDSGIKVIDILSGAVEPDIWSDDMREQFGEQMMQPNNIADIVDNVIELSLSGKFILEEITVRHQLGDL